MQAKEKTNLLRLNNVETWYGHIQALRGVSIEVNQGEIVTLIGSNGAGKSTLLMTICGVTTAKKGEVLYHGKNITKARPDIITKSGIAISPEGRRIFAQLTVYENLELGAMSGDNKAGFNDNVDYVFDLFPRLKERRQQRGGTLSGGEQQMLAMARALMSEPDLLLLDEPSLGLAPLIVRQIFDVIKTLNKERKMTVLLVEQNAHLALQLADRGYVMVTGNITLSDTGKKLSQMPEVRAAYLEGAAK